MAIALPDSLNPSLIVTALYLAVGPHRTRRTTAFAAAAFAVTLAGGVALAFGLGNVIGSLVPKPSATVRHALLLAAGIALVAGGCAIWWRRRALIAKTSARAVKPSGGGASAAALGAGVAGVELLSAFPYFAAIALVVGSSVSLAGKLLLLIVYNVIYALPLFAIAIACAALGERADLVLSPIADWALTHWPHVVAPLCVAGGCGLAAYGLVQLV